MVPSMHSVRCFRISIEISWRRSSGGRSGATNGSSRIVRQGPGGQKRNQVGDELVGRGFDDHGQLHGGRLHLDRGLGVGVEGAVNDVGPMDEIGHGSGIESKPLLRDHGDKTGAGLEVRIVELPVALVALEVGRVGRREKRAFVMVEPPRDLGRTGVLEIDDGILVTVEMGFVKERSGAMQ